MIKNYTSNRIKAGLLFVLVGFATLAGCKKSNPDTQTAGSLSVVNTSPTSATYDVYVDDSKMNGSGALPFGGQIKYTAMLTGNHKVKFTIAGRGETAFTKDVTIGQNTFTTYYLINRPASFDALIVNEDLSATSTDKAFIRFVHVSPDAPAMDLVIKGGASLFTGKAYKTASGFTQIAPGKQTLEIKDGTGAVKATLTDIGLTAGKYYTILARGVITPANAEESAFSGQVVMHQ